MISRRKLAGTKVLLVEDEVSCAEAVKTILEYEGASVTVTGNAEDAVGLIKHPAFDVIVTDIKLPGQDGIFLLGHVRQISPELPVILMTGYSSIGTSIDALKLGAQDYLIKPLGDGAELINSVWQSAEHYKLTIRNRQLQEQLRQREETFRALFRNASDAMFLQRLDAKGKVSNFVEVNDTACDLLGFTRKQLLTRTLLDITAPEYRGDLSSMIKTLPEDDHLTFESVHIARNGDRVPVEISSHMFALNGTPAMLFIARNIAERRETEKRLTEASERDSRVIGQELHDVLCQDLASINMLASVIKSTLVAESSKAAHDAELIRQLALNAVTCTRRLCAGLFPAELDAGGLAPALQQLCYNQEQLFHIPCVFTDRNSSEVPDKSAALHLYRIAQQAVNNAAMHSKASKICVTLAPKGKRLILTVEDDGTGIISGNRKSDGMGLNIMNYRARIIGAVLTISRRKNGGTMVECSWQ